MVYDSYEFGKYLTELRRKYNVSMNVVCDGICDQSVMSRIENGEREVSKLVQDRLLGRLGVAPENFENMVYADEYGYWKARQEIISLIQHEKMDEADKLLEKMAVQEKLFESGDAAENIDINLKLQFYMAMKAQIRCYNGAGDAELKKMYADASRLTISRMKDKGSVKEFFSNRRLAVDEINLLLEYWRYVSPEIGKRFIRGAIEYIDKSLFDVLTKAKIYPKAVYYLCLLEIRTGLQNEKKINQLMNLVTQAIEALRNCLRAFYLCELLDIKIELLRMNNKEDVSYWDRLIKDMEHDTLIDENYDKLYGNTDEFSAEAQYIWCRYTRNVLGEIYKRCGVREDTFEYSHIYVDREVYCMHDIFITKSSNIPESQECYKSLLEMYDDREEDINNCLSMYEHIMRPIASYMGDCGRYDNSDEKELFILQNSLRNRRMTVAYSSMYSMLWNDQQRGKNKMAMHRDIAYCNEIKRCIVLSSFSRNIGKTKFFSNTFKKTKNKIY